MVPSISNSETKPVTVLNIVTHLNSEKHFPAAKDLDLGLVKAWMRALNIGLSNQAVKMLAPKVLEELFILEDVDVKDVVIYQQRHPVKRVTPVVTHFWFGGSALPQKFMHERPKSEESVPISVPISVPKSTSTHDPHVPHRVPGKQIKREITHDITQAAHGDDHCETETKRFVEPINGPDVIISEEAAKELKKAKKASKKARKLIKALEKALPPVGKMDVEDEDDGEDSDWSQSSWNPSWASDEGESEEL